MLKTITNVCLGDGREFWLASVSKFREKKTQICYWTQTHGTVVKTIIFCVCFEEKNDYTVKLGPELRWTGTPFNYYYYYFLFLFWWLLPESLFVLIGRFRMEWNLNCVLGERKRRVWAPLHMVCWKVVWALNSDTFLKNAETWWLQGEEKERTVNTPEEKLPRISPIVLTMKAGRATFYTLFFFSYYYYYYC